MSDPVHVGDVRPFPGPVPDKAQALKPLEEAAEVYAAWQAWSDIDRDVYGDAVDDAPLIELADCIQACCNLAAAMGCSDIGPYLERVEAKNRERGRYGQEARG